MGKLPTARRLGSCHARDQRRRVRLQGPLRGGRRAADRRGVPRDAPARVADHPRPLVRRGRVDPDGRPRRRDRPRERDALPEPGRARLLPRGRERDRAPARLWLRRVREQGRSVGREPLRDRRRGQREPARARPPRALGRLAGDRLPRALMEQRLSLVTLGVADLARAKRFYQALGWVTNTDPELDVAFFQAGGMVVALWSRASLAEDSGVEDPGGWGGISGVFVDPDGHPWEVAYTPRGTIEDDGSIRI